MAHDRRAPSTSATSIEPSACRFTSRPIATPISSAGVRESVSRRPPMCEIKRRIGRYARVSASQRNKGRL